MILIETLIPFLLLPIHSQSSQIDLKMYIRSRNFSFPSMLKQNKTKIKMPIISATDQIVNLVSPAASFLCSLFSTLLAPSHSQMCQSALSHLMVFLDIIHSAQILLPPLFPILTSIHPSSFISMPLLQSCLSLAPTLN